MNYFLVILFFIQALQSSAQDSLRLQLHPTLLHENLILNKKYIILEDTISISSLKFYLSDIALYQDEKPVFLFQKKYHLYDIQDSNTYVLLETIPASLAYNTIKFSIGIDSTTNVSGAMEGDLDPMFGMYWTWQSGYINFKLEGTASRCPARLHQFQWHIGGYQSPYAAQREIQLSLHPKAILNLEIQLDPLFQTFDLSSTFQVMSPNIQAIRIANHFQQIFKIK